MPAPKQIQIPSKTIPVTNVDLPGQPKEDRNAFLHFLGIVIDNAQQKTTTETMLAFGIKEKVDEIVESGKTPETIEFEHAEFHFIRAAIDQVRSSQVGMRGSGWFYLVKPIEDAKDHKKGAKDPANK